MRRFGKPMRGLDTLRAMDTEKMREVLLKLGRLKPGEVRELTINHDSRRRTARGMQRRGRGYTKPAHGRSRTRGSGRGKATTRRFR